MPLASIPGFSPYFVRRETKTSLRGFLLLCIEISRKSEGSSAVGLHCAVRPTDSSSAGHRSLSFFRKFARYRVEQCFVSMSAVPG